MRHRSLNLDYRRTVPIIALLGVSLTSFLLVVSSGNQVSAENNRATVAAVINPVDQAVSPEQVDALSDGHISDAEMKAALKRMAACVADSGYETKLVDFTPPFGWHLQISADTESEANRAGIAMDDCLELHTGAVAATYRSERQLTADQHELFESLVRDCLVDEGVTLLPGRSLASSVPMSGSNEFKQCKVLAYNQMR